MPAPDKIRGMCIWSAQGHKNGKYENDSLHRKRQAGHGHTRGEDGGRQGARGDRAARRGADHRGDGREPVRVPGGVRGGAGHRLDEGGGLPPRRVRGPAGDAQGLLPRLHARALRREDPAAAQGVQRGERRGGGSGRRDRAPGGASARGADRRSVRGHRRERASRVQRSAGGHRLRARLQGGAA